MASRLRPIDIASQHHCIEPDRTECTKPCLRTLHQQPRNPSSTMTGGNRQAVQVRSPAIPPGNHRPDYAPVRLGNHEGIGVARQQSRNEARAVSGATVILACLGPKRQEHREVLALPAPNGDAGARVRASVRVNHDQSFPEMMRSDPCCPSPSRVVPSQSPRPHPSYTASAS